MWSVSLPSCPSVSACECGSISHHLSGSACCSLPASCTAWITRLHNLPPRWVRQPPPCCESFPPCCPSPPLLLVWMNVSSLTPWLLDFHTVQFSVSSVCLLLNLLLSFFWLWEEAWCIYLCLHLGQKSPTIFYIGHIFCIFAHW